MPGRADRYAESADGKYCRGMCCDDAGPAKRVIAARGHAELRAFVEGLMEQYALPAK